MMRVSSLLRYSWLTGARGHNRTRPAFYALNKYRKRAGVGNSIRWGRGETGKRARPGILWITPCGFESRRPQTILAKRREYARDRKALGPSALDNGCIT
jgi:hypothetical protein